MVEPVKDEKKPEQPAQKSTGPAAGKDAAATPAKSVPRGKKASGLIGKLFSALVLLLMIVGAAGYAALIFRDRDERIKVAADFIENELAEAQNLVDTAPKRFAGLLGKKNANDDAPASAMSPPPAVDPPQPEPVGDKPAASAQIEGERTPETGKVAEQPKAQAPEMAPEAPQPAPQESPKPAESALMPATPEIKTAMTAKDDLSVTDLVNALEGRVEALSEEVKSLREKLDQPKNETRATPVAGGASGEAATVVIAFALQKELDAGRPYTDEIAALTRTGADPAILGILTPMAESGAPTGASLREIFKPLAKKIRAEEPTEEQDLTSHIIHGASKLVRVRPTGAEQPETLDGNLAKIDAALTHDNFAAAAAAFAALPEWARSQGDAFAQTLDKRLAVAKAAEDLLHGAIAALGGVRK
jgi:hypothetical protein